jgi:hypothetical protein
LLHQPLLEAELGGDQVGELPNTAIPGGEDGGDGLFESASSKKSG